MLAAAGMAVLTQVPVNGTYAADLLPGLIPMSIGMGLVFVPITLLGTGGVGREDAGLASGLFNTAQQVGGSLGLAILSTVAASRTTGLLHLATRRGRDGRPGVRLPRRVRSSAGDAGRRRGDPRLACAGATSRPSSPRSRRRRRPPGRSGHGEAAASTAPKL